MDGWTDTGMNDIEGKTDRKRSSRYLETMSETAGFSEVLCSEGQTPLCRGPSLHFHQVRLSLKARETHYIQYLRDVSNHQEVSQYWQPSPQQKKM